MDYSREDLEKQKMIKYPMHVGSAPINPIELGDFNNRASNLVRDAFEKEKKELEDKIKKFNEKYINTMHVYDSEYNFEPIVGNTYYRYERDDLSKFLSMIKPNEWGSEKKFTFIGAYELQSDYTWKKM